MMKANAETACPPMKFDPPEAGVPVRVERHQPVDRGEGGGQAVEAQGRRGDALHAAEGARLGRFVLAQGHPVEHPHRHHPDGEVDGGAQDEEVAVEIPGLLLDHRVGGDRLGARPDVDLLEPQDDRHEQQQHQRQGAGRRAERSPDHQPPGAAGHLVQQRHGVAAQGDAQPEEPGHQVGAVELAAVDEKADRRGGDAHRRRQPGTRAQPVNLRRWSEGMVHECDSSAAAAAGSAVSGSPAAGSPAAGGAAAASRRRSSSVSSPAGARRLSCSART